MNSDYEMIVHKFKSNISISPVADVHLGAAESCEQEWAAFCKQVLDTPDRYLILAGDLLNNSTRSTRFANPFEERYRPMHAKKLMVEYLEPIKDRILCVVSGNHEQRTLRESDQDLTYDICAKLGIEELYRENFAVVKIQMNTRPRDRHPVSYMFYVTHGSGGGIYTGASVNRSERQAKIIDGIDCFIVGHNHKSYNTTPSKMVIDSHAETVRMVPYSVVGCPSWLAYGGYSARHMLEPAAVANPQIIRMSSAREKKEMIVETKWSK